jgi:hypothetical protein
MHYAQLHNAHGPKTSFIAMDRQLALNGTVQKVHRLCKMFVTELKISSIKKAAERNVYNRVLLVQYL